MKDKMTCKILIPEVSSFNEEDDFPLLTSNVNLNLC